MIFTDVGIISLSLFLTSTVIFTMTPGLDTLFVLNRAVTHGKHIGMMAGLGVSTGVMVHTLFAGLGLSAIVAKSTFLFMLVKYLGALYLVYLGSTSVYQASKFFIQKSKTHTQVSQSEESPVVLTKPLTLWQVYYSGIFTNILNPKVALFFLAFFPQFIAIEARENIMPYIILGSLYAIISAIWLVFLGAMAGSSLTRFLRTTKAQRLMDMVSGVVFVGMGAKIAFDD